MKHERHAAILSLIQREEIETQEELASRLRGMGFEVTQATVSRDIKELRLVKVAGSSGGLHYAAMQSGGMNVPEKLMPVFSHAFVSADNASHLVVVKTLSGMAQALASAVDSMKLQGILGSVAGDDTVLIICKTELQAEEIVASLQKIAGGYHAKNA